MTGGLSAILTYHSLDDSGSPISVPPAVFRRQMAWLAGSGIPVVTLEEAPSRPGSVAITFDDGFSNLLDHAAPVLEQYSFPWTVFVVSEYCGGRNNWPSQPRGSVPDSPLLNWAQIASLPGYVSVGAHTMTHPFLTRLSPEECRRELAGCQDAIEQHLGRPAPWLAYPYGASSPGVREAARLHFDLAVGTSLRLLPPGQDRMDLPRIDAYYFRGLFPLENLFTAAGRLYLALRRLPREVRRVAAI